MTTYAVTGATGQLGAMAVRRLLERTSSDDEVIAVARRPAVAADLRQAGALVRPGDYDDPGGMAQALRGVDRLLLVSSNDAARRAHQHAAVIGAARKADVARIVYTSMLNAPQSTNPLADDHRDTERLLAEAPLTSVSLRNGWYTENYAAQLSAYVDAGEIVGAAGQGRVSAATRGDLAEAAAVALTTVEPRAAYELGGPSFDLSELAALMSELAGATVRYRDLPVDEYARHLRSVGLDDGSAAFVAELDASIARGDLETSSRNLGELLGRPPVEPAALIAEAAAGSRA